MNNIALTENGAISHATTGSAVLNLFFKTLRDTKPEQISTLMSAAWKENPLLTLKAVFHLRDCRGGKGERKQFYECIRWLIGNGASEHVKKNLEHVPFYGTYKDLLLCVADTELEFDALKFYARTLMEDIDTLNTALANKNVNTCGHANVTTTLAAKWAPTEGGSLDREHKFAKKLCGLMRTQFTPKTVKICNLRDYRTKLTVPLRTHTDVVERHMCSMDWSGIKFDTVPSVAMKLYRKAFEKHEEMRFKKYLEDVKSGKAKINASQVFPHQLVKHYMKGGTYDEVIELQWKEIVRTARNAFSKTGLNAFPLVDVSGSMSGEPMEVAIALGLLLSEIATAPWVGAMLTFQERPDIFRVDTSLSLKEKVEKIKRAPWGGNTNLAAAFDKMLDLAVMFKIPKNNMPKTLYIFSDMQFDEASPSNSRTNFQEIERKFSRAGYTRPNVVFWNLRGNTVDFPVEQHVPRCALVSGFSQSLLNLFLKGEIVSPYAVMLEALMSPRYERISVADE